MKKTYLILIVSLIAATTFGQSLERTVFNSTGGEINTGALRMVLSVGEPIVGMVENRELGLSQGYLTGTKTVVATTTGIEDIATEQATVYPNPFSTRIHLSTIEKNINVEMINMVGQTVYSGTYSEDGLDMSELPAGIYIIRGTVNQKTIINTKLLKQ